ncbi:putative Mediator of RNA polymerase II transcription subunit 32 [Cocos nucifera]|uniref:Putative Mediator of RNA polymerase II transcription subunit 32 n=1 Tax=Cocos nucifera TaxID=13894 RepID=A0A8K0I2G7_COCNU|nr:putative Mediator of RNA polymerase II transcription subunit 32 [Cocos nucifera]
MDGTVDDLTSAYDELIETTMDILEARAVSGGQKMANIDAALVAFREQWETFQVVCDLMEDMVEQARCHIGLELLVDVATDARQRGPLDQRLLP